MRQYAIISTKSHPHIILPAESKKNALGIFLGMITRNPKEYFQIVTEKEARQIIQDRRENDHNQFITEWMSDTLVKDFHCDRKEADELAELAFDLYEETYDKYHDADD